MDSNNLTSNNYSPNTEANNDNQSNDYQNNWNPTNTYPNNANQTGSYQNNEYQNNTYQNNSYQNNGYQNGYQNNSYVNNDYQNNWNPENTYQNGYQNGYQNNVNPNNGYQTNIYQNSQQPVNDYYSGQYQNATKTSILNKRNIFIGLVVIVAAVIALSVGGFLITNVLFKAHHVNTNAFKPNYVNTNASKPNYNCSAEKSANIEEYFHCNPSEGKALFSGEQYMYYQTVEVKGDTINVTLKSKNHISDDGISKMKNNISAMSDDFTQFMPSYASGIIKDKIIAPLIVHMTFLNDDGSFIGEKYLHTN